MDVVSARGPTDARRKRVVHGRRQCGATSSNHLHRARGGERGDPVSGGGRCSRQGGRRGERRDPDSDRRRR
eukprot:3577767-Lingulodinium_polyedra.AAC.1